MKILHTADWHLGAYVGPQCDDPRKRMENTIKCLDRLVETARREQPDIILVCGDIWHVAKTWNDRGNIELRVAADYLDKLKEIAFVVVLYGTPNHDSHEMFNSLVRICGDDESNCCFLDEPDICTIHTKSGPIQIAGLPGFDKGHFRAQFPGLSAEEENQVFTQQLTQILQGLSAQVDPNIPSVLMAHHTVVGCELDNGQHVFQANEVVLPAGALDASAFDLVCLGHIHRAQRVEACNKQVYYSGSIDAFTFNDEEHIKGFWIHDTDFPGTGHGFYETPAREFTTFSWDPEYTAKYSAGGFTEINKELVENQVVRILYSCDSDTEKALDKKILERVLYDAGAYYVSEIRPESITAAVNRERMTEKLTVSECLDRYLTEKGKTAEEKSAIFSEAVDIVAEAQASSPMGSTSGLFLPVEIEVRNYRSYAEEKLSFEDIFFAMVNGKNGSGKSSLFMDAITDCLYEETRENELTGWIRNGEKSGSISFTFRLGDDLWRVTRTRQRSGKATLALAKYDVASERLGQCGWRDMSCERLTDTQQKIVDLLGMDCDTFQSCVLIMQDRYGKFMEADKSERMSVLANLLGLGIYDELLKITKEQLTDVNREIRASKEEVSTLENEIADEENLHTELQQAEVEIRTAQDDLQESKEQLNAIHGKIGAIAGYEEETDRLQNDLKANTESYTAKKAKRDDLQRRVDETNSFLKNEQSILDKCAELDKARLDIAALDGKLQLLNDKRIRCGKLNMDLIEIRRQRQVAMDRLSEIESQLKEREQLKYTVERLSNIESQLEDYEEKAAEYKSLDNQKYQINVKMDSLQKQSEMLKDSNCIDVGKAQCRFLQSAKTAALKREEWRNELDSVINQISELQYDPEYHDSLITAAKTYRTAKDKLAQMAADGATAEQLKLQDAEYLKRIDAINAELEVLSQEIAVLENETGNVSGLKARVTELTRYEQMKEQLTKAKQFIESTEGGITQLSSDIEELAKKCKAINDRLNELVLLTVDKGALCTRKRDIEIRSMNLETFISRLNQQIGTINANLKSIAGKKKQLQEKQEQLHQAAKQAATLEVLTQAFSQDGIPYQIIRDIVPELEAAANEILGQMSGGRMRLEFVTEKVLKSNKAKEVATLEIIITDVDNGVLPYLSRSGGQKVRAALANSFALAMIKASRVGLQLGMLFIDEPSFLDADGIEGYCSALETIHNKYPDMRILAISHDENMKSRFPQQLYVEMTENGSKVRVA